MLDNSILLLRASDFAAQRHCSQRRSNVEKTPYINHPLQVAVVLADEGGVSDVSLLAAAVLHDTVEDTDATIRQIESLFGQEVGRIVSEVTDDKSLPKQRRKELQVEAAPQKSDRAKQLKIADKICNIRDMDGDNPVGWSASRKLAYLQWASSVVDGCRGVNVQLDDLFDQALHKTREAIESK